jgi:hypothetical protein
LWCYNHLNVWLILWLPLCAIVVYYDHVCHIGETYAKAVLRSNNLEYYDLVWI